jgi:hypothetical protein
MKSIKLYLDEDVEDAIAKGLSDLNQVKFATASKRSIFTHNIGHFVKIHIKFLNEGLIHGDIIVSKKFPYRYNS